MWTKNQTNAKCAGLISSELGIEQPLGNTVRSVVFMSGSNDDSQDEVDELVDEMATEFFEDGRILMEREDGTGEVLLMRILAEQLVAQRQLHAENWELVAEFIHQMAEYTGIESERHRLYTIAHQIEENAEAMKDDR